MPRALVIVLDSVGCGHAPDAAAFGDAGADTLGHLLGRIPGLDLPHLASLGLYRLLRRLDPAFPHPEPPPFPNSAAAIMAEASAGKDTTTGHWELMGAITREPFATFERFPADLVAEIERAGGVGFLGNEAASGTEIIARLGAEHLATGKPILYTSADSVLQIAAHEEHFGLERLYEICRTSREVLDRRGLRVGRVIARPFVGGTTDDFRRSGNRHDYSLLPPPTVLNRLVDAGIATIGVGKIDDIFAGSGISRSLPTADNAAGMAAIDQLWDEQRDGLIFVNLVDFDAHFGHRRDPQGYAQCLREFDAWLGGFLPRLGGDFLLITADHGNDPYHPGTDHTRERVPLLTVHAPVEPADSADFTQVADLVARHFGLGPQFDGARVEE